MFSHPPILHIRQPSSTTTEFTVTTRPPPSLQRTLTTVLTTTLRILLLLTTTLLLLSQHRDLLPPYLLFLPHFPPVDPKILYPASVVTLWVIAQRGYTEESLLVVGGLGVQTSTTAGTCVGMGRRARFIPTEKVRDVVVNEGFVGMEVRFYVAVIVEGERGLVVVFPTLLPNRRICEQVWRGARKCLYQPDAATTTAVTKLVVPPAARKQRSDVL